MNEPRRRFDNPSRCGWCGSKGEHLSDCDNPSLAARRPSVTEPDLRSVLVRARSIINEGTERTPNYECADVIDAIDQLIGRAAPLSHHDLPGHKAHDCRICGNWTEGAAPRAEHFAYDAITLDRIPDRSTPRAEGPACNNCGARSWSYEGRDEPICGECGHAMPTPGIGVAPRAEGLHERLLAILEAIPWSQPDYYSSRELADEIIARLSGKDENEAS